MQLLEKQWEMRKHRDIKLVTTKRRRNYLVSKPNYHTTKFFTQYLLAEEIKKKQKTQILMNKLVYLGLSILELSKILIYEFWYDYAKPKYSEKAKLRCMIVLHSLYTSKQMIFIKTLQKMLKQDLILQFMN